MFIFVPRFRWFTAWPLWFKSWLCNALCLTRISCIQYYYTLSLIHKTQILSRTHTNTQSVVFLDTVGGIFGYESKIVICVCFLFYFFLLIFLVFFLIISRLQWLLLYYLCLFFFSLYLSWFVRCLFCFLKRSALQFKLIIF